MSNTHERMNPFRVRKKRSLKRFSPSLRATTKTFVQRVQKDNGLCRSTVDTAGVVRYVVYSADASRV